MPLSDEFIRLARALAHRRKLKFKRGNYAAPGWSMLGHGYFGEAWEHADHPGLVVKVSGRASFGHRESATLAAYESAGQLTQDSWQVYAQYCHKHPHMHLPKIMHFERINATVAWAIMPKYRPYNPEPGQDTTRRKWQDWLSGARDAPEWMWPIIGMASSLRMTVDLHQANVMVGGAGTLIMTDPFSGMETF